MLRLTLSMPCYLRPRRTIRAIESICNQNINGWEALVVGDGCPIMSDFILSNTFDSMVNECRSKGNILSISNNPENKGGCGYSIINQNINAAKGKYFLFLSNDDIILPFHFDNYLSGIENTDYDFVCYNSYIEPTKSVRFTEIKNGCIGHSELIVKTEFLKKMPLHTAEYGHDWLLVNNMVNNGGKYCKLQSNPYSYIVKGLGDLRQDIID